ncbi:hypothetical protein GIB67_003157 [Kingdonia uniflora]|uniref:Uncharacterized protein n=1 Tax=Kingdonia uniflora TaxID=39325 RepID=A0A7J7N5X5_9MAGN|nr:hypothetical protein GIB67_003157 [Kingdonia uniflora]
MLQKDFFLAAPRKLIHNNFKVSSSSKGVVTDSEDTIKAAADSLGGNGFINYFGLQIQCDIIREALEYYKASRDIDEILRQLPRHLVAERAILQCLKKCPGNYLQALKAIPRTLRMIYLQGLEWFCIGMCTVTKVTYGIMQQVLECKNMKFTKLWQEIWCIVKMFPLKYWLMLLTNLKMTFVKRLRTAGF